MLLEDTCTLQVLFGRGEVFDDAWLCTLSLEEICQVLCGSGEAVEEAVLCTLSPELIGR